MKPGLSLRVSQHLALTPQLQQSIRLLQLSTLELNQEVSQMLDDNPFLELQDETAEREDFGIKQSDAPVSPGDREFEAATDESTTYTEDDGSSWDGDGSAEMAPDDGEWGIEAAARNSRAGDEQEQDATVLARSHESLQTFLHRQALSLHVGSLDAAALHFLIESLNDDGYLDEPLELLTESLLNSASGEWVNDSRPELLHHFTVALHLLQSLEPTGVGARDLAECLRLQLHALQSGAEAVLHEVLDVALGICAQPMELLARRDIKRLVQLGVGHDAKIREAIALIARLEPKPGRKFIDVERNIIVPDVLVTSVLPIAGTSRSMEPRFRVQLNPEVMPRLRVHDIYANALRSHRGAGDAAGHAGLQQRLQEARWFIKNIQQRFDTILRVSTAIVDRQRSFFTHGELAMRPLVLREIADELGLHESTISRVTTAKYMATPFGTYELKYFFGSGLGTDSGSNASSTAVRALIKQFISAESQSKPLSDNQISDMLKEQGIDCARRTVAKYREGLKIAPASLRKAL